MSLDQISYTLGQIDSKLTDIVKTQNDILANGCHLGREHSRQISELQKKNGVKKSNGGGNWIEVTKDGIKSHGVTSLIVAILLFMAWNQYHKTPDTGKYVSRHELQRELDAFAVAKAAVVKAADKVERSAAP